MQPNSYHKGDQRAAMICAAYLWSYWRAAAISLPLHGRAWADAGYVIDVNKKNVDHSFYCSHILLALIELYAISSTSLVGGH